MQHPCSVAGGVLLLEEDGVGHTSCVSFNSEGVV